MYPNTLFILCWGKIRPLSISWRLAPDDDKHFFNIIPIPIDIHRQMRAMNMHPN